jgi:hypothetical protein
MAHPALWPIATVRAELAAATSTFADPRSVERDDAPRATAIGRHRHRL